MKHSVAAQALPPLQLFFCHNDNGFNRIEVETPGGHLAVEFDKTGDEKFENIWLCGPAKFVFKGETDF